jgi:hypothetical protein
LLLPVEIIIQINKDCSIQDDEVRIEARVVKNEPPRFRSGAARCGYGVRYYLRSTVTVVDELERLVIDMNKHNHLSY